jgi:hypothetical protein
MQEICYESPAMIWPKDHSWYLRTGIDDHLTVIGSSMAAQTRLVRSQRLTAAALSADDVLVPAPPPEHKRSLFDRVFR